MAGERKGQPRGGAKAAPRCVRKSPKDNFQFPQQPGDQSENDAQESSDVSDQDQQGDHLSEAGRMEDVAEEGSVFCSPKYSMPEGFTMVTWQGEGLTVQEAKQKAEFYLKLYEIDDMMFYKLQEEFQRGLKGPELQYKAKELERSLQDKFADYVGLMAALHRMSTVAMKYNHFTLVSKLKEWSDEPQNLDCASISGSENANSSDSENGPPCFTGAEAAATTGHQRSFRSSLLVLRYHGLLGEKLEEDEAQES